MPACVAEHESDALNQMHPGQEVHWHQVFHRCQTCTDLVPVSGCPSGCPYFCTSWCPVYWCRRTCPGSHAHADCTLNPYIECYRCIHQLSSINLPNYPYTPVSWLSTHLLRTYLPSCFPSFLPSYLHSCLPRYLHTLWHTFPNACLSQCKAKVSDVSCGVLRFNEVQDPLGELLLEPFHVSGGKGNLQ